MKSKIKKYLLMMAVCALVLAGCDSKQPTIGKENAVENKEMSDDKINPEAESAASASEENEADADALYNKAMEYHREKEYEKAVEYYEKAAALNHSDAVCYMGLMYQAGLGVEKNVTVALEWLKKSADMGNSYAMFYIGDMYYGGNGVEQNYTVALEWYEKSANLENDAAMAGIAQIYYFGHGVEKNDALALEWYEKAANLGYAYAMYQAGFMYHMGEGSEKNDTKAFEWIKKSADAGYKPAMYMVGRMYYSGEGVEKNDALALEWLEKAAESGDKNAAELIANIQKSTGSQASKKEGNIAGIIKISDYTFMGLPVNENHYEEWKEKLGYTGDDTLEDSAFTTYETEYGLVSCDKKYSNINLKNSKGSNCFSWSDLGESFQVEISIDSGKTDLISGPVLTGMTEEEIKTIIGYDESKFIEEIEDDGSKIKRMDLSEGHIIIDEENPYFGYYIKLSGQAGSIGVFIKDNIVTKIIIHAFK